MKQAYAAAHEQRTESAFQFASSHLVQIGHDEEGRNKFEIQLPVVFEPVPFEQLVQLLLPQFHHELSRAQRFVDDTLIELRRQQLADAIAAMIKL